MKEQDKKEIRQIFNEGFEQLVLPHFNVIYKNMDDMKKDISDIKKDLKVVKEDIIILTDDVGSINRKLDVEIAWRDDASKRLKRVETKLGFAK